MFPHEISLLGFFIESESLVNESMLVTDENLCVSDERFNLKEVLKDYRTLHQYEIHLKHLKHFKQLTEVKSLFKIKFNDNLSEYEEVSGEDNFAITDSGMVTAFVFWFEFGAYYRQRNVFSSKDEDLPLAAIMFYNDWQVDKSYQKEIRVKKLLKNNIFCMDILRVE